MEIRCQKDMIDMFCDAFDFDSERDDLIDSVQDLLPIHFRFIPFQSSSSQYCYSVEVLFLVLFRKKFLSAFSIFQNLSELRLK